MAVVTATIKHPAAVRGNAPAPEGAAAVAGDTTDGFTWANTGDQLVTLYQSGSTNRNVTIKDSNGTTVATVVLPSTTVGVLVLGPFPVKKYGAAPVLVPAHAEVLFSVYDLRHRSTGRPSGITVSGGVMG